MYQAGSWMRPRKVVARLECSLQPDGGEGTATGMRQEVDIRYVNTPLVYQWVGITPPCYSLQRCRSGFNGNSPDCPTCASTNSVPFPLVEWFDLMEPISREDRRFAEAELLLAAHKKRQGFAPARMPGRNSLTAHCRAQPQSDLCRFYDQPGANRERVNDMLAIPKRSWRAVLPVHPAADLLPMIGQDELRALGEDIRKNGLKSPVTV
jgi:hypothetical protein